MFPFREIGGLLIETIPGIFLSSQSAMMFWLVAGIVFIMYRRVSGQELRRYGMVKMSALRETVNSIVLGLAGGLVGSMLLVFVGVAFPHNSSDFLWLWGVSLGLALIHSRFMCFAYSGGLISLCYLLLGWPRVHVAAIAALVAVLHVVEAILIRLHGPSAASPVLFRNGEGRTVGGFMLHRFWPVPVSLILSVGVPDPGNLPGSVQMPDWWPILKLPGAAPDALMLLLPVVAGMGYGDLAVTAAPAAKALRTSRNLLVFSIGLLALALLGSHQPGWLWAAAAFSVVGHEAVIRLSAQPEVVGRPHFQRPSAGVRVLDVFPGTSAAAAGLMSGAVIHEVDGTPVNSSADVRDALRLAPRYALLRFSDPGGRTHTRRVERDRDDEFGLGLVLVPDDDAPADMVLARGPGPWGLVRRLFARWTR